MSADEDTSTNRRSVLKGIAGGAALGAAGVGALTLTSSPAAAETNLEFNLGDASVASADGSVAYLASGFQGYVSWENFSEPVEYFTLTDEIAWGEGWNEIHSIDEPRSADNEFGRKTGGGVQVDTAESGRDGHITFHIANPNGSWRQFTDATSGDFFTPDSEEDDDYIGPTWIIMRDDGLIDEIEDFPLGVDPDYGLPDDAVHTDVLPTPEDGESEVVDVKFRKTFNLLNENEDVLETVVGEGVIELTIENIEGETTITAVGQAHADSPN